MKQWVLCVCMAAVLFLGGPVIGQADENTDAATAAASLWLELLDEAKYQEGWRQASGIFRQKNTQEEWESKILSVRTSWGDIVFREHLSIDAVPGIAIEESLSVTFATYLKNKSAVEKITVVKENGIWKVAEYLVE
ncbi:DUF4019 domain-containing protein [Desulfosarcina sp. OttesenSCG-928-G10]|nr:DUF4019 domain-containing protein [Desulfosarcina sp. OttesenSCG-928-G10]MDL2320865.1 DUF4019 domain-containing protein [Desulfosarcina sp. OttesenSCG-928-B08]